MRAWKTLLMKSITLTLGAVMRRIQKEKRKRRRRGKRERGRKMKSKERKVWVAKKRQDLKHWNQYPQHH